MLIPALFVVTTVLQQAEPHAAGYMAPAMYPAGSLKKDEEAPGGHGTSNNFPVKATLPQGAKQLILTVTPGKGGVTVKIVNAGPETWISATDGNLAGYLEAESSPGKWVPIEFRYWASCGNSYHRVVLPHAYQWEYQRKVSAGNFATRVRFHTQVGQQRIYSKPIQMKIDKRMFQLPPEMAKENYVDAKSGTCYPNSFKPSQ